MTAAHCLLLALCALAVGLFLGAIAVLYLFTHVISQEPDL